MDWVRGKEEVSPTEASMLIQGIALVPGWSEKNFQVKMAHFNPYELCVEELKCQVLT